jgi:uncharacterized membrane protein
VVGGGRVTVAARRWGRWLVIAAAYAVILGYLAGTPAGLWDKADLVGYAICHRIPSHSLMVGGRQLPLCARCSGTFLGAMVAVGAFWLFRRRHSELPPLRIVLILLGFSALMALDGLNSYVSLLPFGQPVYAPTNAGRLLTGTLHGLMIGTILYPIAVGTFFRTGRPEPVLRNLPELGALAVVALGLAALPLTGWAPILYALALVSTAGVLVALTLVNTVMVVILARRENTADSARDLLLPLLVGLAVSVALIAAIDIVRYGVTGTLSGLPGLPQ